MERLEIHEENPQKRFVQKAVQVLEKDGLLIYPTESGYAVGCNAESPKAIQKLYQLKKPLKKYVMALLFKDLNNVTEYAKLNNFAFKVVKPRIPGPYTYILPAHTRIVRKLSVKRNEIGIRFPDHPFLRELFELFPHPILNTAARVSEDEYHTDPDLLEEQFRPYNVDMMISCGNISLNPTNIINLVDDDIEVIRGEWD